MGVCDVCLHTLHSLPQTFNKLHPVSIKFQLNSWNHLLVQSLKYVSKEWCRLLYALNQSVHVQRRWRLTQTGDPGGQLGGCLHQLAALQLAFRTIHHQVRHLHTEKQAINDLKVPCGVVKVTNGETGHRWLNVLCGIVKVIECPLWDC